MHTYTLQTLNRCTHCFYREGQPGSSRSFSGQPKAAEPLSSHVHHASAAVRRHRTDSSDTVWVQRHINRFRHRKQTVHLCQRSATYVSGASFRNSEETSRGQPCPTATARTGAGRKDRGFDHATSGQQQMSHIRAADIADRLWQFVSKPSASALHVRQRDSFSPTSLGFKSRCLTQNWRFCYRTVTSAVFVVQGSLHPMSYFVVNCNWTDRCLTCFVMRFWAGRPEWF